MRSRRGAAWGTAQAFGLMLVFSLLGIVFTRLVIEGALIGTGLFLVYRLGVVRTVLTRHHRAGIGLSRDGDMAGHCSSSRATPWAAMTPILCRRRASGSLSRCTATVAAE